MEYHKVSQSLAVYCSSGKRPEPVNLVVSIVSSALDVKPDEILSRRRGEARIAWARHVAMYLAHTSLGMGQRRVASRFGRDRTTVRHACQRIEDSRDNPATDRILDCLEATLQLGQLQYFGGSRHA